MPWLDSIAKDRQKNPSQNEVDTGEPSAISRYVEEDQCGRVEKPSYDLGSKEKLELTSFNIIAFKSYSYSFDINLIRNVFRNINVHLIEGCVLADFFIHPFRSSTWDPLDFM
ncbi:hypothetical protein JTB14_036114 [Gonioctena quinquepunctata]|nr:hypothetical protein JTB14_036114 [Gonioctena quinquepunctata]